MIGFMLKAVVYCVGALVLAYAFFFVPLGKRTMFEHVFRIAQTEEARDLAEDLGQAGQQLTEDARRRLATMDAAVAPSTSP